MSESVLDSHAKIACAGQCVRELCRVRMLAAELTPSPSAAAGPAEGMLKPFEKEFLITVALFDENLLAVFFAISVVVVDHPSSTPAEL